MRQLTTLAWKEWREAQAYLWIGLGVFLGLPLIGGFEEYLRLGRHFEIEASPWVAIFGGVLAIFVAVGSTCRDLTGKVEDFWQSRPVSVSRWLLVKYAVGAMVALAACAVPLIAQNCIDQRTPISGGGFIIPAMGLIAVYSIAFAAGSLLRRTAHAAMVGIALMLMMMFLPLILPPLSWISTFDLGTQDNWGMRETRFTACMIILSIIAITLSLLAVGRDWRIQSGLRMMYGSIAAVVLIACGSAAFQLGSNLPVLQIIDLPKNEYFRGMTFDGQTGGLDSYGQRYYTDAYHRSINLTPSGITLGTPIKTPEWYGWANVVQPDGTHIGYWLEYPQSPQPTHSHLVVRTLLHNGNVVEDDSIQLWTGTDSSFVRDICYTWGNRLYVVGTLESPYSADTWGDHLATLDITDPLHPRLLSNTPFHYQFDFNHGGNDEFILPLPNIPGLEPRGRLSLAMHFDRLHALEGDTLCTIAGYSVIAYHLDTLTDTVAAFTKRGSYTNSTLEQMFGVYSTAGLQLKNGLLYQTRRENGVLRPSFSVYDTRGPHSMQLIGHFAGPGTWAICPLPDGRALVGGDKLYLVGKPPRTGSN